MIGGDLRLTGTPSLQGPEEAMCKTRFKSNLCLHDHMHARFLPRKQTSISTRNRIAAVGTPVTAK